MPRPIARSSYRRIKHQLRVDQGRKLIYTINTSELEDLASLWKTATIDGASPELRHHTRQILDRAHRGKRKQAS
jgi:hypothetical protein